jgi:hypothetical protein
MATLPSRATAACHNTFNHLRAINRARPKLGDVLIVIFELSEVLRVVGAKRWGVEADLATPRYQYLNKYCTDHVYVEIRAYIALFNPQDSI